MVRPLKNLQHSIKSALLWLEIRRLLRSQRSFWFLFLFLLGLLVVVWQSWAGFASEWAPDGDTSRGSRMLFYKLVQGHLLFICIVTPLLMAPAIVSERESETFQLLVSSPISVFHLIFAKLLSPLLFVILLLISGLPILSWCFTGGGLSVDEVIKAYLILLTATLSFGMLGLYCSTLRRRVYEVYLLSVISIFLFGLIVPFHGNVWYYINTVRFNDMNLDNHGFQFLSPFFALREEIRTSSSYQNFAVTLHSPINFDPENPLVLLSLNGVTVIYIVVSILITMVLLLLIHRQVNRIAFENESEWDIFGSLAKATVAIRKIPLIWPLLYYGSLLYLIVNIVYNITHVWLVVRNVLLIVWVYYLFKGLDYLAADLEEVDETQEIHQRDYDLVYSSEYSNPGLFLERRVQWFAKSTVLLRLTYIALMLSILLLPLVSYDGAWLYLTMPFIISAFFTLPLASTSVSVDHERGTLDLLRTTMVSNDEIIHAKFITNLHYNFMIALTMFMPGILILTVFTFFTDIKLDLIYHFSDLFSLLWYPIILFCSLVLYTSVGIFCSTYFMNTNKALILSGIVVLICLVLPSPIPILNVAMIDFTYGGGIGLSFLSPIGALALVLPPNRLNFFKHTQDFTAYSHYLSYIIVSVQCLLSLLAARFLYKKSVSLIQK